MKDFPRKLDRIANTLAVGVYEAATTRFDTCLDLHPVHLLPNWTSETTLVYYIQSCPERGTNSYENRTRTGWSGTGTYEQCCSIR
jgi:hypothetical protein